VTLRISDLKAVCFDGRMPWCEPLAARFFTLANERGVAISKRKGRGNTDVVKTFYHAASDAPEVSQCHKRQGGFDLFLVHHDVDAGAIGIPLCETIGNLRQRFVGAMPTETGMPVHQTTV
jgi:DNA-binding Lrp family transcriptional regulator